MLAEAYDIPVDAIRTAAGRAEVVGAMRGFHVRADTRIAAQQATCWNRGLCCQFGKYGHRLFVTTLEVAYYLALGGVGRAGDEAVCPHAVDGMCRVRDRRPMGCRIFFCDQAAQHWQGPLTEELLAELRAMHYQLHVPYHYMEWLTVLRALVSEQPSSVQP